MHFRQLISSLRNGEAELQEHSLEENPDLLAAASIEQATSNQLSFLEKGSHVKEKIQSTNAGAILLPVNKELKDIFKFY